MSRNPGSGGAGGGPSRSWVEFDGTSVGPSRSVPSCCATGESTRQPGVNSADCGDKRQLSGDVGADVTRAPSSLESRGGDPPDRTSRHP
eukprot:1141078-Rhodomonas_salina.1